MTDAISISVVVCTRNRAAYLRPALQALCNLELPPYVTAEIMIVDNASTDQTRAIVSDHTGNSTIPMRYIYEPRPGLSVARNRGVSEAKGSLLLFTDDDCLPDPAWIISAVRAAGGNLLQVIGGRIELHSADDLPVTIKTSLAKESLTSHDMLRGFVHGCNMIIGRQVFDRIGLFDIRLGAGTRLMAGEDTDLLYRAFKAGIPISYDPGPVVFHNHRRTSQAEIDRLMHGYMVGNGAFATKCLLDGDLDPAKKCWWELRAALRQWKKGQAEFSRVVTETFTLVGGAKFIFGASFRKATY